MPLIISGLLLFVAACRNDSDPQRLRPRQLRDVPARALAFKFQADVDAPASLTAEEAKTVAAVQQDFDTRRKDDALSRTVLSPDGNRALAVYGTADDPSQTYRIDLYSSDGNFLRNLTPPDLAVVFQDSVVWSPDSGMIAFIGRRNSRPEPSPTPFAEEEPVLPSGSPVPTPSIPPAFAPLAVFTTEQVYLCNRDGYDLKPLTTRDGLIYFGLSWAPDNHALAALACRESEWETREREFKTPAGRPRLISPDGQERLLDDALAEVPLAWSPDSSKVATAFGVDIGIYDAAGKSPTQARIRLHDDLVTASRTYEEKLPGRIKPESETTTAPATKGKAEISGSPASFNPIVRLEWPAAEKLYLQTGYVRLYKEPVSTWQRWHLLMLSPQAAVLGR